MTELMEIMEKLGVSVEKSFLEDVLPENIWDGKFTEPGIFLLGTINQERNTSEIFKQIRRFVSRRGKENHFH